MLRLSSSKTKGCKDFWKPSKPCHVGIHWIALAEYSQMNTHMPVFQSFFRFFLHHFVLAKLAISSIRVIHYHRHMFLKQCLDKLGHTFSQCMPQLLIHQTCFLTNAWTTLWKVNATIQCLTVTDILLKRCYRWTWIWRTRWDQENWSVICKIRRIHMTNTWYASDWDQTYHPSYAKIRRTVVRHIQVHLYQ